MKKYSEEPPAWILWIALAGASFFSLAFLGLQVYVAVWVLQWLGVL